MKNTEVPDHLIKFLHRLADISGEAILPFFRTALHVENKSGAGQFDPVTHADRKAEEVIRHLIEHHYPNHGITGEEFGDKEPSALEQDGKRWIIDPIDGTRAFMMGFPTWGTLIGLLDHGGPVLGMMNQPFTGERFWSWRAAGKCYYQGIGGERILRTRRCQDLADAYLTTTGPEFLAKGFEVDSFYKVSGQVKLTRYGGDCYSYCMLAAGQIDLVIEAGLKSYDIAPLIPIIEGAGGVVTCWDGSPAYEGGRILACGDPSLHHQVLKLLNAEL